MTALSQKLETFFKSRSSDPKISLPSSIGGWFEQARVTAFQSLYAENISKKTENHYARLTATIYEVFSGGFVAIVASYPDQTILWLDDHSTVSPYQAFVSREQLVQWLPHRINELAQLIVETRFNFLGMPRLLYSTADIMYRSEERNERLAQSEIGRETLLYNQTKFAELADRITSPRLHTGFDEEITLTFFLWTRIRGKVFEVRCVLGSAEKFIYTFVELADWLGDFHLPR